MNCDVIQRNLLGRERPDRPSADAVAHLAGCAACREWLQRLLQIEDAVIHLPVPPAEAARSALVRRILADKADNGAPAADKRRRSIAMVVGSWIMDAHAAPRRRVAAGLVAGVAAALLLFVTGWLVWDSGRQPPALAVATPKAPPDRLLADLRSLKVRSVQAAEGTKGLARVQVMAAAAEELREQAALNPGDDDLIRLAVLYGRVVNEGVLDTVRELSAEDRRKLPASLGEDLKHADSEWQRLSQKTGLSPRVKDALAKAAESARDGHVSLRDLCSA
jgi:hypothetical protein